MLVKIKRALNEIFKERPPAEQLADGALPPTQAKLADLINMHRLSSLLPYQSYDDENELFYNDDCYGFILEVSPAVALDEDPLRVLASLFSHGMEAGTNIQICHYGSPDILPFLKRWASARNPDENGQHNRRNNNIFAQLARRRVEFMLDGAWDSLMESQPALIKDIRIFVSLTQPLEGGREPSSTEVENMTRLRTGVLGTLKGAGFAGIALNEGQFIDLLQSMLNPQDARRDYIQIQEDLQIREQVVLPSTMALWGRDSICIESESKRLDVRSYSVQEFPQMWAGWNNSDLIGSGDENNLRMLCPYLITLNISFTDQLQALSTAKMKATRATQMAESPVAKQVPNWHEKRDEWNFVTRKIEEGHTMVKLNYQVVQFAPEGKGDQAEHQLLSIYKSAGWRLVKNRFTVLNSLLAALPFTAGPTLVKELAKLKMYRTFLSWTAANLAPMIGEWKGTRTPLMLLAGRRGQIAYLDPWDNKQGNYNVSVAAAPGAGKSVAIGDMTIAILGTGGKVYTFDRGRSYEKLCALLGGSFIAFEGGNSTLSMNPFTFIQNWEGSEDKGAERIMLKALIAQMASPSTKLKPEQLSWIEEALEYVWITKGHEAEITDVYERLAQEDDQRKKDLADAIRPYTKNGFYGSYFTGPSNIDLNNDYVVLEMKELDGMPELQAVVLLILMMRIGQSLYLGSRNEKTAIIVDEAWKLMSGNAGEFIEELARTARKHNGSLITITQGINDYYKSETALAAFESSDWIFLLRQKQTSISQLVKTDRLPMGKDGEKILTSVETIHGEYSEIAVISPDGMAVQRLYLDPFTEKLLSSKGDEYQIIKDAMDRGENVADAIDKMVIGAKL